MISVGVIRVIVMVGGESTTILSIEVLGRIPAIVQVDLRVVVSVERPKQSVPSTLLAVILMALVL